MDPKTAQILLGVAGAAGAGEALYVDDVFSTFLYEGDHTTSGRAINNGIDLAGEGGCVWLKHRTGTGNGIMVQDTERFVSTNDANNIDTSSTAAESHFAGFHSFNSNGFSVKHNPGNLFNAEDNYYVSWSFRKAPGFFDVVTYTGNGSSSRTISHNLGSEPGLLIVKNTSSSDDWYVKVDSSNSFSYNKYLKLNTNDAFTTGDNTIWAGADATSTVFSVGGTKTNNNNNNYVAYLFASGDQSFGTDGDEAIIKCGSYSGNGTAGRLIDLGFEPQWLLHRRSNSSNDWKLFDVMRGMDHADDQQLKANETEAELAIGDTLFTPASTGFIVESAGGSYNQSGGEYIYVAIRRPHKPPEAGTDVFAIDQRVATAPNMVSGFVADAALRKPVANTYKPQIASRLTGPVYLRTSENDSELNFDFSWDYMNGFHENATTADSNIYSWMFRRAPGFFDVVAYDGTGSAGLNITHNLGVKPDLYMIKRRNSTGGWNVYANIASMGATKYMNLNNSNAVADNVNRWNDTEPTATQFTLGDLSDVNSSSGTYVAYLFATLDGISKVGSYTFSGSDVDVDCGFTNGARFVLIKGLDSGKDWSLFDTTRGIVSGNDPKLSLNNADPHDTGGDWIDPINSGFRVLASAGNDVSDSGVEYLFLAIA